MPSDQEKKELRKRFDEFEKKQPETITLGKAGLRGEDVVLRLVVINGISVYWAPMPSFWSNIETGSCNRAAKPSRSWFKRFMNLFNRRGR